MKYLLTDVSYELEEQHLSPSYLLLVVHQCYNKLALQKKDKLIASSVSCMYFGFLGYLFLLGFGLGGFFFQTSSVLISALPPTNIGSNA